MGKVGICGRKVNLGKVLAVLIIFSDYYIKIFIKYTHPKVITISEIYFLKILPSVYSFVFLLL